MALTLFVMFILPAIIVLTSIGLTALARAEAKQIEKKTFGVLPLSDVLDGVPSKPRKISPREREQWWINLWLDNWKRAFGTPYIPFMGDADYVAPYVAKEEKMPLHIARLEDRTNKEVFSESASSTETNRQFEFISNQLNESQNEYTLRRTLDPTMKMTDFQWSRLYPILLAHEERRKSKLSHRTQDALERLALKRQRILETTHETQQ